MRHFWHFFPLNAIKVEVVDEIETIFASRVQLYVQQGGDILSTVTHGLSESQTHIVIFFYKGQIIKKTGKLVSSLLKYK